ncbi:hypothetical protein KIN20_015817 [Parelaphostrongylus tenuis]|uniref:Uncharacterized protein n=1 Tax=Parelaphostrongylus tenuis TaxID=148309 RepID=A0AAD5MGM0_PARTN|nr:hypothetical protein KIN20_015817 [Parelaphostrongylus tenuis]
MKQRLRPQGENEEKIWEMSLRFNDKVAMVRGDGGGLRRTYALELQKQGCKIVVNDLSRDTHGTSDLNSTTD